jgi:hypothetical protein
LSAEAQLPLLRTKPTRPITPATSHYLAPVIRSYRCLSSGPPLIYLHRAHVPQNQSHHSVHGHGTPVPHLCALFRPQSHSRFSKSISVLVSLGCPYLHAEQHCSGFRSRSEIFSQCPASARSRGAPVPQNCKRPNDGADYALGRLIYLRCLQDIQRRSACRTRPTCGGISPCLHWSLHLVAASKETREQSGQAFPAS